MGQAGQAWPIGTTNQIWIENHSADLLRENWKSMSQHASGLAHNELEVVFSGENSQIAETTIDHTNLKKRGFAVLQYSSALHKCPCQKARTSK
jgi:hypothetical protein